MIKNLINFLIIATIAFSLEAKRFIYDVENTFDKVNNKITIENNSDESAFYLIIIKTQLKLYYRYDCSETVGNYMVNVGSFALSLNLKKKEFCDFLIKGYDGPEIKGTFMVHPLNIEIKVDFNQKEKYAIDGVISAYEKSSPIIYSISNLEEDISVKFTFLKVTKFGGKTLVLANPFKVCLKDDCKEKIQTFNFLKGNNYRIYLTFEELKTDLSTRYWIPPFSFEKI